VNETDKQLAGKNACPTKVPMPEVLNTPEEDTAAALLAGEDYDA